MDLEEALVAELRADVALGVLVGERISPFPIPLDAELPALAYQRISGPREYNHAGPSGFARARVQLTCTATGQSQGYAGAKAVFKAVRECLSGFRGYLGGYPGGSSGGCSPSARSSRA